MNTQHGNTSLKRFDKPIKKGNRISSGERGWVVLNKRDTAILVSIHQNLVIQTGKKNHPVM